MVHHQQPAADGQCGAEPLCCCDRAIAGECLPGCTLLLTLFEELSLESDSARRYLVQSGPGAGDLPTEETLLLSEMPSVVRACEQARPLYRSGLQPAALKWVKQCTVHVSWWELGALQNVTNDLFMTCHVGKRCWGLLATPVVPDSS
jgi:hypothetical protein